MITTHRRTPANSNQPLATAQHGWPIWQTKAPNVNRTVMPDSRIPDINEWNNRVHGIVNDNFKNRK